MTSKLRQSTAIALIALMVTAPGAVLADRGGVPSAQGLENGRGADNAHRNGRGADPQPERGNDSAPEPEDDGGDGVDAETGDEEGENDEEEEY